MQGFGGRARREETAKGDLNVSGRIILKSISEK
jgi:hypothetical protein